MSEEGEATFTFECPECSENLEVNEGMKEALLEHGCVLCGAALSTAAFQSKSSPA